MSKDIVKVKLDIIFKKVFTDKNNEDLLHGFISSILDIDPKSITNISIENSEITPEDIDGKFSRMDLKLTVNDMLINVEMQIGSQSDFSDRVLFYWSKLYSGQLRSGEEYGELKKSISVNILNFKMFDCTDFHSEFVLLEKERHELLSDKCAIHFFELKKINKQVDKNNKKMLWLQFINAESEEELVMLESTNIPEIKKACTVVRNMSEDARLREISYQREKRLHDEASALGSARREGRAEGRAEGLSMGLEQGISKGIEKGMQTLINNMRQSGMSEDEINRILNIDKIGN